MMPVESTMTGTRIDVIDSFAAVGSTSPSGRPAHISMDPDEAEIVLHGKAFDRQSLVRRFTGLGLLFSDGTLWRERRRIMQPGLPQAEPAAYDAAVGELVGDLVAWLDSLEGEPVPIVAECTRFSLRVLYRTVFDLHLAVDHELEPVLGAYFDRVGGLLAATVLPGQKLDAKTFPQVSAAQEVLDREIGRVLELRRASGSGAGDALGRLIAAQDSTGEPTEVGIQDEIRSFFLAGAETSANTIAWALLMLDRHPETRRRLEEAIDHGGEVADEVVDQVVFETLRLFPPVWFQTREAISSASLGPRSMDPGDQVFVATYLIHRDPAIWRDPHDFQPDRFRGEGEGSWRPPHRYAYFPFGGGRHLCIGRQLALVELRLAIREICRRFRVHLEGDGRLSAEVGAVLKPGRGLQVRIVPRGSEAT